MRRFSVRKISPGVVLVFLLFSRPLLAQQKGQWLPGQVGLNAGIMPNPGVTVVNIDLNYSAGTLNNGSGSAVPLKGSYDIWVVENIIYYVPNFKVLGGHLMFGIAQPT